MATHPTHEAHRTDDGEVHAHISSTQFYWGIFGGLIILTLLTVKVSYYDFGSANIIIALLIATMKASLVAAFFMHLRYDKLFNTVAFLSAFLFLAIFILLTYDDLGVRGRSPQNYTEMTDPRTGELAPGGEPATSATVNEVPGEGPATHEGAGDKKKE
ncbi:MAG: cytochrome C oxidase subunit IV family protein [Myxococcota bacterium]|nr:cytochrome C oxidase subunit IV family protein [Myxococcota bacterium]